MNCNRCGFQNVMGDKFCKGCGSLLEVEQPQQVVNPSVLQQPVYSQQVNQPVNQGVQNSNGNLDPNYVNNAVNPNMKKWAILSIVVPVVAIIWYLFIGLNLYLAVVIAAVGFSFAEKGKMADQKLATIGKVCNGILIGMGVVMVILNLILALMG